MLGVANRHKVALSMSKEIKTFFNIFDINDPTVSSSALPGKVRKDLSYLLDKGYLSKKVKKFVDEIVQ